MPTVIRSGGQFPMGVPDFLLYPGSEGAKTYKETGFRMEGAGRRGALWMLGGQPHHLGRAPALV